MTPGVRTAENLPIYPPGAPNRPGVTLNFRTPIPLRPVITKRNAHNWDTVSGEWMPPSIISSERFGERKGWPCVVLYMPGCTTCGSLLSIRLQKHEKQPNEKAHCSWKAHERRNASK